VNPPWAVVEEFRAVIVGQLLSHRFTFSYGTRSIILVGGLGPGVRDPRAPVMAPLLLGVCRPVRVRGEKVASWPLDRPLRWRLEDCVPIRENRSVALIQ
jgi:hypothetical protein